MSEFKLAGFDMHTIASASERFGIPLVNSIWRLFEITRRLKLQGMQFTPAPDSFFLSERPSGNNAYYYDAKTDTHVYTQK
jgi:hypothetical protein